MLRWMLVVALVCAVSACQSKETTVDKNEPATSPQKDKPGGAESGGNEATDVPVTAGANDVGKTAADVEEAADRPPTEPMDHPVAAAEGMDLTYVETPEGKLSIRPLQHSTFYMAWGDVVIHVDPVAGAFEAAGKQADDVPKADLVLVTDLHHDHLDPEQIARVRKPGGAVVAPALSAKDIESVTVMNNGDEVMFDTIKVQAVPMYNLTRKRPDNGELFHVKGRGNGYLVTRGETTIYISGDTACIDEMKALKDVDVAFVCMNLPYTMPADEAAACVEAFKPAIVYPFHHRGQDPTAFAGMLKTTPGVEVRILDWYPASDDITGKPPE